MALNPSDVGIILSYRCQAACKHCIYNCGPTWQEWATRDQVREALEAVRTLPPPVQVHITGGEPFLNFELLLDSVRMAAELGIPRYVETNAGWCVSEELVTDRLLTLREAGLQAIQISCSPFHAETIPPARTRLAVRKATEILGAKQVTVYMAEWQAQIEQFGLEEGIPLERYVETYGAEQAGKLLWQGYKLQSGGRSGYRLGHLIPRRPATAFRDDNCLYELVFSGHAHMDLYGNYIPDFCGGLSLGDWHQLPRISTRLQLRSYPHLTGILVESGPFGLFEMADQEFDYEHAPEGYAGKCHLCVDVRRALLQAEDFAELRPHQFYTSL